MKTPITQEMIDAVFSDPRFRCKFPAPKTAQSVCQMRLTGAKFKDVAKRHKVSEYYCTQAVDKCVRLYTVFLAKRD